jgi:hypothetical protein
MKNIIANKKFMERVAQGEVIQTLRVWKKKHSIRPGEIVNLFNFRDKLQVRITDIYEKQITELTTAEAQANGHESALSLIGVMNRIYGATTQVIVIRFVPVR